MITEIMTMNAYGLGKLIYEKLSKSDIDVPDNADLPAVRLETERQANEMQRLEAQAKVAQETAIASRIEGAAQVEIEEFYEYSGDGKAGLHTEGGTLQIGLSASGKRVSKRIYRFTGSLRDFPIETASE